MIFPKTHLLYHFQLNYLVQHAVHPRNQLVLQHREFPVDKINNFIVIDAKTKIS
jgi:hypothetical protein